MRIALVGLGTIAPTHLKVLGQMRESFHVSAVCDCDPERRDVFESDMLSLLCGDRPAMCASATELVSRDDVDIVVVATPPATHYDVARAALEQGKHVLLEKPATLSIDALAELYRLADGQHVLLHVAFHTAFAEEVEWLLSHREQLGLSVPSSIECVFDDPYMRDGHVLERKRPLGGSHLDSGVNALSVCGRLIGLEGFELVGCGERLDTEDGGTVCEASYEYEKPGCTMRIETSWARGSKAKTTRLRFAETGDEIVLDHTAQQVMCISDGASTPLFAAPAGEHLPNHYLGMYRDFSARLAAREDNRAFATDVHRLLLAG